MHVFLYAPFQAVLQQAHIAGQKTAGNVEVLATDGGMKLLDEAISLAQCYKVAEAWEVRLRFIVGLEAAASTKLGLTEVSHILSQISIPLSLHNLYISCCIALFPGASIDLVPDTVRTLRGVHSQSRERRCVAADQSHIRRGVASPPRDLLPTRRPGPNRHSQWHRIPGRSAPRVSRSCHARHG